MHRRNQTGGFYDQKSMTGFGRAEVMEENRKFTVEIKSVNHRYFDVNIKMPKKLGFFESAIRNLLKKNTCKGAKSMSLSLTKTTTRTM